jgi:Flp pilus assembly pilin Flp
MLRLNFDQSGGKQRIPSARHLQRQVNEMAILRRFLADQHGGTAIEYALIAVILGTGLIGSISTLGTTLNAAFVTFAGLIP